MRHSHIIALGCKTQTSNNMIRADTGCRPLISQVIKRYILYVKKLKQTTSNLSYDSFNYETETEAIPNFMVFLEKFNMNIDILQDPKIDIKKLCSETYDRFWRESISESPKAISFIKYKTRINLESYLFQNLNLKHKIAISRFRLSSHLLMIERGRHMRPKLERNERFCYFCNNTVENEEHFLLICPLYSPQRKTLETFCRESCNRYDSLNSEQKFIFIMSNESNDILKILGKFTFDSMGLREKIIEYFYI